MPEDVTLEGIENLERLLSAFEAFSQKISGLVSNLETEFISFSKVLDNISGKGNFAEGIFQTIQRLTGQINPLVRLFNILGQRLEVPTANLEPLRELLRHAGVAEDTIQRFVNNVQSGARTLAGAFEGMNLEEVRNITATFRKLGLDIEREFATPLKELFPSLEWREISLAEKLGLRPTIELVNTLTNRLRQLYPAREAVTYQLAQWYRFLPQIIQRPEAFGIPPRFIEQIRGLGFTPEQIQQALRFELLESLRTGIGTVAGEMSRFGNAIKQMTTEFNWSALVSDFQKLFLEITKAQLPQMFEKWRTQLIQYAQDAKTSLDIESINNAFNRITEDIEAISRGRPIPIRNLEQLSNNFNIIRNQLNQFRDLFGANWQIIDRNLNEIAKQIGTREFEGSIQNIINELRRQADAVSRIGGERLAQQYSQIISNLNRMLTTGLTRPLNLEAIYGGFREVWSDIQRYRAAFAEITTKTVVGGRGGNLGNPIYNFVSTATRVTRSMTADWEILMRDFQTLETTILRARLPEMTKNWINQLTEQMTAASQAGQTEVAQAYRQVIEDLTQIARGRPLADILTLTGREIGKTLQSTVSLMGQQILFGLSFALIYLPVQRFIMESVGQASRVYSSLEQAFRQILVLPNIGQAISNYVTQQLVPSISEINQYIMTLTGIYRTRDVAQRLVSTALEIARIQPIQFEQAMRLFTAFAIFPGTQRALGQNLILRTIGELGRERQIPFAQMLTEVAQYLGMLAPPPQGGIPGAIFALRELFAGQTRSIERRFNVSMEVLANYARVSAEELKTAPPIIQIQLLHQALTRMLGERVLRLRGADLIIQINNIIDTLQQHAKQVFIDIPMRIDFSEEQLERLAELWGRTTEEMQRDIRITRTNILQNLAGMVADLNMVLGRAFERTDIGLRVGIIVRQFIEQMEQMVILPRFDEVGFQERIERLSNIFTQSLNQAFRIFKPVLDPIAHELTRLTQEFAQRMATAIGSGILGAVRDALEKITTLPVRIAVQGNILEQFFGHGALNRWITGLAPIFTYLAARRTGFAGIQPGFAAGIIAASLSALVGTISPILQPMILLALTGTRSRLIQNLIAGQAQLPFRQIIPSAVISRTSNILNRFAISLGRTINNLNAFSNNLARVGWVGFMGLEIFTHGLSNLITRTLGAPAGAITGRAMQIPLNLILGSLITRSLGMTGILGTTLPLILAGISGYELIRYIYDYVSGIRRLNQEFHKNLIDFYKNNLDIIEDTYRAQVLPIRMGTITEPFREKIFETSKKILDIGQNLMSQAAEVLELEAPIGIETRPWYALELPELIKRAYNRLIQTPQFMQKLIQESERGIAGYEQFIRQAIITAGLGVDINRFKSTIVNYFRNIKFFERIGLKNVEDIDEHII